MKLKVIQPIHISPKFYFLSITTKSKILKVYPVPYVADFNYKKFKVQ